MVIQFSWALPACLPVSGSTALVDLGRIFSFLIDTQSLGFLDGDQPVSRPLPAHRITQRQNKRTLRKVQSILLSATDCPVDWRPFSVKRQFRTAAPVVQCLRCVLTDVLPPPSSRCATTVSKLLSQRKEKYILGYETDVWKLSHYFHSGEQICT
jgi:hypothetical protein